MLASSRQTFGLPFEILWQKSQEGKVVLCQTVYSVPEELLTSTDDSVSWWKQYFEDILDLTDMSY